MIRSLFRFPIFKQQKDWAKERERECVFQKDCSSWHQFTDLKAILMLSSIFSCKKNVVVAKEGSSKNSLLYEESEIDLQRYPSVKMEAFYVVLLGYCSVII